MIPSRLAAPEAGWTTRADVVVIGSGIAGLTAALRLYGQVDRILVVTKDVLNAGSTQWAQGGIAAALGPGDTPDQHEHDTLVAGAGACDREAVRILVNEGPDAVHELISWGAVFDQHDGVLSLTREGGHHRDRIAHAGGDATGAEIQRALIAAVERAPEIEVIQHALAIDLLAGDGRRRRRRDPPRAGRGPGRRRRPRALPCGRPGQRRTGAGLLADHQPGRRDRRRHGARVPGRRRAPRPRVRAVPPDRDVARVPTRRASSR